MSKNKTFKKSLGQNFLKDPKILKKIADFAKISKSDLIFEVGPGEGTLTKFLLQKTKKVVAIEKDAEMIPILEQRFKEEIETNKLEIINNDILTFDFDTFPFQNIKSYKPKTESFHIVGNIPYYITGAIFKKVFELQDLPKSVTFVIQKEVGDRIMARDKKESLLSIALKSYGIPKFGGVIKAGSFFPKPKVDSVIISIEDIGRKNFKHLDEKRFFEVLKAGFSHKRKFLIKNLNNLFTKTTQVKTSFNTLKVSQLETEKNGQEILEKVFEKISINKKARAEDLKVDDWLKLTKEILAHVF